MRKIFVALVISTAFLFPKHLTLGKMMITNLAGTDRYLEEQPMRDWFSALFLTAKILGRSFYLGPSPTAEAIEYVKDDLEQKYDWVDPFVKYALQLVYEVSEDADW